MWSPAPAGRWRRSSSSASATPRSASSRAGIADDRLAEWLADYRFSGNIRGYGEGELFFSGSPVLVVEGSFAEVVLLETLMLSIFNHDSAVASAASRMTLAAEGRPIIEMGGRRTHEWAAVASARAAWIAGFGSSSDLEAGRSWGIPVSGTAAHAFTMLFDTEEDAFRAQLEAMGVNTTLLVDTYDVDEAIRLGVRLTDGRRGAIRLDSGDLSVEVHRRALLTAKPPNRTIVTNDLDEYQIAAPAAPGRRVFGVCVTGSGTRMGYEDRQPGRPTTRTPRSIQWRSGRPARAPSRPQDRMRQIGEDARPPPWDGIDANPRRQQRPDERIELVRNGEVVPAAAGCPGSARSGPAPNCR